MRLAEAFADELSKIAAEAPKMPGKPGLMELAKGFYGKHPVISGAALGWLLRGILSRREE